MPVPPGQRRRLATLCFLLVALAGLFIWGGTVTPDPAMNDYPGEDAVGPNPQTYVGEQVTLGGTVVNTDPVVVRVRYGIDESFVVTLQSVGKTVETGDSVSAFGTLRDDRTLVVDGLIVRQPWRYLYMYGVSFLGGLWVLGRIATQWRLDRTQWAVVPRSDRAADGDHDA